MKRIFVATLCLLAISFTTVMAADVGLQWDANKEKVDGYRIFVAEGEAPFNYSAPAWQGSATECDVAGLTAGVTYRFVARAYVGSLEAPDSDIIVYQVPMPSQIISYPKQVRSLTINFGE